MAHASNVSSLVLGKASGRLLATGGDDCRVNLWSINKPNCIMVSDELWPQLGLLLQALVIPGPQSGPAYHWCCSVIHCSGRPRRAQDSRVGGQPSGRGLTQVWNRTPECLREGLHKPHSLPASLWDVSSLRTGSEGTQLEAILD